MIRRWDLEAIAVHVQTLQLLAARVRDKLGAPAIDQVLAGLRKGHPPLPQEAAIAAQAAG